MVTICARIHSGASSSPNVLKRMLEWTALAGGMRARRKNCSHAVNYCVLENACRILAYNQMCAACGGKVLCLHGNAADRRLKKSQESSGNPQSNADRACDSASASKVTRVDGLYKPKLRSRGKLWIPKIYFSLFFFVIFHNTA